MLSRLVSATRSPLARALAAWRGGTWSGEYLRAEQLDGEHGLARLQLSWEGRDGRPIERTVRLEDVVEGERFAMRVTTTVRSMRRSGRTIARRRNLPTKTARFASRCHAPTAIAALAFLIFRFFALRRELGKLKNWAETGKFRAGGLFEQPASQVGFAVLSAFILWPFFGLTPGGFAVAAVLTTVVALHELGHMAAFRMMGHRKVRMIFMPLLGGIAIGGRPYDSRFEVAFVALMGAGFSAFLVPIAIAASIYAGGEGWRAAAACSARSPASPRSSTSPISCRCGNSTAGRCCGRSAPGRSRSRWPLSFCCRPSWRSATRQAFPRRF